MAYATVDEFKDALDILTTDADKVANMQLFINAAENAIDTAMNRPHGFVADSVAEYRYYVGQGQTEMLIDECVEVVSVAVKSGVAETTYTAWTSPSSAMANDGDWFAKPFNAPARQKPYTRIVADPAGPGGYSKFTAGDGRPTVRISAKWGYSIEVPAMIKMVTIAQAGRWYNQAKGGMSEFVADPATGELKYGKSLNAEFVKTLMMSGFWDPPMG